MPKRTYRDLANAGLVYDKKYDASVGRQSKWDTKAIDANSTIARRGIGYAQSIIRAGQEQQKEIFDPMRYCIRQVEGQYSTTIGARLTDGMTKGFKQINQYSGQFIQPIKLTFSYYIYQTFQAAIPAANRIPLASRLHIVQWTDNEQDNHYNLVVVPDDSSFTGITGILHFYRFLNTNEKCNFVVKADRYKAPAIVAVGAWDGTNLLMIVDCGDIEATGFQPVYFNPEVDAEVMKGQIMFYFTSDEPTQPTSATDAGVFIDWVSEITFVD